MDADNKNGNLTESEDFVEKKSGSCKVCSDKACYKYYGVLTCDSCRTFFRRHVLHPKNLKCHLQNNCKINVKTRKECSHCRFKKCLEVKMRQDLVSPKEQLKFRKNYLPGGLSISDLVLLSHGSTGGGFGSFGGLEGMISLPHHHQQHQQEQLTQSSLENVRQAAAAAAAAANASLYRNLLPQSGGSLVPNLSAIHGSPSPSTPPSMRNHHSILSGLPSVSTCTNKPPESGHFKSDYQQLYSTGGVPEAAPVQCSPLNFNRPFNNSNYTPLGLEYGNLNLYNWLQNGFSHVNPCFPFGPSLGHAYLNQMYSFPGGGHQSPSEHFHSGLLKRATEDLYPSGLHPNIKDPDSFDDNDNNGIRGSVHEREDGSDPLDQSWSGSVSPTSRVSLKKKLHRRTKD